MNPRRFKAKIFWAAVLACVSISLFPLISTNGAGGGFCDGYMALMLAGCDESGAAILSAGPPLESLIEEGSGNMILAYVDVLKLLSMVELSNFNGIDYEEMHIAATGALEKIGRASAFYGLLIDIAAQLKYNPTVRDKLRLFDYQGFMESRGLTESIFSEVRHYLGTGDIRGTLERTYLKMQASQDRLNSICGSLARKRLPSLDILWEVSELFAGNLIFGQHIAMVFKEIKDH